MNYRIVDQLVRDGFVPHSTPIFCGDLLRNIKLYFPPDSTGNSGLFVKISCRRGVEDEYRALIDNTDRFGDFVILPLRLWCDDPLTAVAYPLKKIRDITAADLSLPFLEKQLVRLLTLFTCQNGTDVDGFEKQEIELNKFLSTDFHDFLQGGDWVEYIRSAFILLRRKAKLCAQHSDFSLNNLVLDPEGKLTLLDWEDYGKIQIPFFDAATFLFSLAIDQGQTEAIGRSPEELIGLSGCSVVTEFCRANNFHWDDFSHCFPLFMLLFVQHKKTHGYGDYIVSKLKGYLNSVLVSPEWRPYLA